MIDICLLVLLLSFDYHQTIDVNPKKERMNKRDRSNQPIRFCTEIFL